jgi:hypothetical protein
MELLEEVRLGMILTLKFRLMILSIKVYLCPYSVFELWLGAMFNGKPLWTTTKIHLWSDLEEVHVRFPKPSSGQVILLIMKALFSASTKNYHF